MSITRLTRPTRSSLIMSSLVLFEIHRPNCALHKGTSKTSGDGNKETHRTVLIGKNARGLIDATPHRCVASASGGATILEGHFASFNKPTATTSSTLQTATGIHPLSSVPAFLSPSCRPPPPPLRSPSRLRTCCVSSPTLTPAARLSPATMKSRSV